MARQIRFIEPVDSISGDLGQKQKLLYAKRNNSAWDAPRNTRNAARNYKTTYVGLYRKFSGKKYFAVRKRSTFHSTPAAIKNMALMGAANAIAVLVSQDLSLLTSLQLMYAQYRAGGGGYSFRQWIVMHLQPQIYEHMGLLTITQGSQSLDVGFNPFMGTADSIAISSRILIKFAEVIDSAWAAYYINDDKGVTRRSGSMMMTWSQLIGNSLQNTFGLTTVNVTSHTYVKFGNLWLLGPSSQYVQANVLIVADYHYRTTDVHPQA